MKTIASEQEFIVLMEQIDAELRQAGVEIAARPLRTMAIVSERLNIALRLTEPDAVPTSGSYRGDDLSIRIHHWFNERYGDRLKRRWGPGETFIVVRGDAYRVHLPGFLDALP
jgi:hypothetical protein